MGAVHHHHHNTLESLNSANANGMAGETTTTVIGLRQPNRLFGVDNIGVSAAAIVIANQVNTLSKIERSISKCSEIIVTSPHTPDTRRLPRLPRRRCR